MFLGGRLPLNLETRPTRKGLLFVPQIRPPYSYFWEALKREREREREKERLAAARNPCAGYGCGREVSPDLPIYSTSTAARSHPTRRSLRHRPLALDSPNLQWVASFLHYFWFSFIVLFLGGGFVFCFLVIFFSFWGGTLYSQAPKTRGHWGYGINWVNLQPLPPHRHPGFGRIKQEGPVRFEFGGP